MSADAFAAELALAEEGDGRPAPSAGDVQKLLETLAAEGFLADDGNRWRIG
jgi:hypothetical protein